MRRLIMMFGLPASGKSTYIESNYDNSWMVISADKIKEVHPDYQESNPEALHEYSVKKAEEFFNHEILIGTDIVFDGGGINNSYNKRLIAKAKENGYNITLIVMNTPAHVCLQRNKERSRKVPEQAIIEKAIKFDKCLNSLSELVNSVLTIEYYSNNHVFIDMDGTIAAYRQMPLDQYGCIDFMNGEYFRFAKPVFPVIDKLKELKSKLYILSAAPDNICQKHKHDWLDKFLPVNYNDRYFIGNKKYKAVMLRNIMKMKKFKPQNVTVIDDDHSVLLSYQEIGVNAIHISEFLTWEY